MLLRRPLMPLLQLFQLFRVLLDVEPRRRSLSHKQTQTLTPAAAVGGATAVLVLESLGWRLCARMVPSRVSTRGSAAVPRTARGAMRRGGGRSG